ncbi:MAG: ATP-binding protein [Adlercreutzia equolifaciens]
MYDEVFSPPSATALLSWWAEQLLDQLEQGLQSRPGSRERAVVILGQRGSGKTVLLWELADRMRKAGVRRANPTIVSDGMLERILESSRTTVSYLQTESCISPAAA